VLPVVVPPPKVALVELAQAPKSLLFVSKSPKSAALPVVEKVT
jgi:hypothetical protein